MVGDSPPEPMYAAREEKLQTVKYNRTQLVFNVLLIAVVIKNGYRRVHISDANVKLVLQLR